MCSSDLGELGGTVYVDHGVSSAPDATVWVAVRPEKVRIHRERPEQADNVFAGTVKEIAYLGDVSRYLVALDSGKLVRVTQPNTDRRDDRVTWEERVWLAWSPGANVVVMQ